MSTIVDVSPKLFYTPNMANTDRDGYAKVLKIYSRSEISRALKITRSAVSKWGDVIPEAYILQMSILTGMAPEEIAPQTYRRLLALRDKGKPA
jgi:hypothetical protein